jgi:hypothetical protein
MDDPIAGLTLFEGVVAEKEQTALLQLVDEWLAAGAAGTLRGKSYEAPPEEWQRTGQGRRAVLFGVHVKCNKVDNAAVEPLPPPLLRLLDAFEAAGVFTPDERPDTCCVNVYDSGAWLPPHVDSEAFDRPFCTLSLLSEQQVVFGESIEGVNGEWCGRCRLTMPVGSVLRVAGAAAGPHIKHALPRATAQRISLTFRKLGAARREAFASIRLASAEAAAARRERRLCAKEARRRPRRVASGDAVGQPARLDEDAVSERTEQCDELPDVF